MAKNSAPKAGGPARIRLVVLDAEVGDGDISALTQALQNALRGPTVVQKISHPSTKAIGHQSSNDELDTIEPEEENTDDAEEEISVRQSKPRAPRKAPKEPDVLEIDMNSDVSFADFAKGKKSDSWNNKYMIAAAWLKEHRDTPAVTDSHIYTCFRSIGWSTNLQDFGQPLRDLKGRKFFTSPERGQYAINHIGLDYVKKLGGSDGSG